MHRSTLAACALLGLILQGCDNGTSPPERHVAALQALTGGGQTAPVGTLLPDSLVARALDDQGRVVPGAAISWEVTGGDGTVAAGAATADANGRVAAAWRLGTTAGPQSVTARSGAFIVTFTATATPGPAARVVITPDSARLNSIGTEVRFIASTRDSYGNVLPAPNITWTALDSTIAKLNGFGIARAVSNGVARFVATGSGFADTAAVRVRQLPATIGFSPNQDSVAVSRWLQASSRDSLGHPIPDVIWSSSMPTVASVDGLGVVRGVSAGTAEIRATAGDKTISRVVRVHEPVTYPLIGAPEAGGEHTCASTGNGIYCWGSNAYGQLGYGRVPSGENDLRQLRPVPIANTNSTIGGLSAGGSHTCAVLTHASWLYCWGANGERQLGHPSAATCVDGVPCSPTPGQLFWGYDYALPPQAGRLHTCGAFSDGARCWGDNASGQVGDGTTTDAPNPVTITRRAADAGSTMTCSADLWCWGTAPVFGQHTTPSRVGDPLVFTKVAVGGSFACGLTSAGAAYCFGDNRAGQLGRGTFSAGEAIGPVSGGLAFTQLSAGETFVCGLSGGAVYCWGAVAVSPAAGDVGCAGGRCVATPQPEAPGFTFGWLSAGGGAYTTAGTMRGHVCGSTTAGIYCWGRNDQGQLGNGTRNSTNTPQQVRYVRDS